MPDVPRHIEDYVALLKAGTPFTLSNIGGDGEFLTITGWDGTNSDGRESTPEKATALAETLLKPRLTYHGYNPGHLESEKRRNAEAWLRKHGINVPIHVGHLHDQDYGKSEINVRWVHKEIISSANVRGKLNPFLRVLSERPLMVVGPSTLSMVFLIDVLHCNVTELVPPESGWEILDILEAKMIQKLSGCPPDVIVTWSLGYLTKVLMWRLAPKFPQATQIDVGAIWDPYCGLLNRHGYRRPEWEECKAANLEGLT